MKSTVASIVHFLVTALVSYLMMQFIILDLLTASDTLSVAVGVFLIGMLFVFSFAFALVLNKWKIKTNMNTK